MIGGTITESQRNFAKVAGITQLVALAAVLFANFGVIDRLAVTGNAAATAQNIVAHELLFRIGIACNLIYCLGLIAVITAFYVILEPVNRSLALLGAVWKLVYALSWVLMTFHLFDALRLACGAGYLRAFEVDRLQALAKLSISVGFDRYYGGLLFYSLGSVVVSYLWLKSRYIPRALAAWGLISYAWCGACTFVFLIFPGFSKVVNLWWFDTSMGIFELTLSFWLLFKGLKPSETNSR